MDLPSFYRVRDVKPDGFRPKWIVIHHSSSSDGATRDWDGIRKYHMSYRYQGEIISQGQWDNYMRDGKTIGLEVPWRDVGYHFGIEDVNGVLQVMTGRKIGDIGAHAQGFNSRSVGICCVGNFDKVAPSTELIFILKSLCRQLQIEFGIPRDQVIGHRETFGMPDCPPAPSPKTCPGRMFDMDSFRSVLRG